MALRDELVDLVDEVRDEVIDTEVGLRLHTVQTRRRTWSGGEPGAGSSSDSVTTLEPTPKVKSVSPRLMAAAPGTYREGDLLVRAVSATYTADDLTGGDLAAGEEFVWLIDGDEYIVVQEPDERYLEWRVHLRGRNRS